MKTVNLVCSRCEKEFSRPVKEHERSLKLARPEFCSRACSGEAHLSNFQGCRNTSITPLQKYWSAPVNKRKANENSKFSYFVRKAKARRKGGELTIEQVKAQWEKQNGKCAYTGISLILRRYTKEARQAKPWELASLDRIDSSKGYQEGNIQFVSVSINYLKHEMSDESTKEFLSLLKTNVLNVMNA